MHIQITKTFSDLGITHTEGTREHVAASVAERYFEAKVAAPVKYASAAERLAVEESLRNPAKPAAAVWTVRVMPHSQKLVVQHEHCGTQITYGPLTLMDRGRPDPRASEKQFVAVLKQAKCPQSVIDQWREAANRPDYLQAEAYKFEADKRAHAANEARLKDTVRFL